VEVYLIDGQKVHPQGSGPKIKYQDQDTRFDGYIKKVQFSKGTMVNTKYRNRNRVFTQLIVVVASY
jgi:hypothetical protein